MDNVNLMNRDKI